MNICPLNSSSACPCLRWGHACFLLLKPTLDPRRFRLHDPSPAAPLAASASTSGPAALPRPRHVGWSAHLDDLHRCWRALPQQLLQLQLPPQGPQRASHCSRGRRAVRGELAEVLLLEHFMSMGSQVLHLVGQPGSQGVPVRACSWQHLQGCSNWVRLVCAGVPVKVCAVSLPRSGQVRARQRLRGGSGWLAGLCMSESEPASISKCGYTFWLT